MEHVIIGRVNHGTSCQLSELSASCPWGVVHGALSMGRCPWGEFLILMSIGQVVLEAICPWGELSKRVLIGQVDLERDAMGQDFMGRVAMG
jgi:hypothetical protein